jgi:hypothetical protein
MSDKKNRKKKNKGSGEGVGMDSMLEVSDISLHSLLSSKGADNIDFANT